ncbi:hypothetical protein CFB84_00430 [Burkholderia aenigmatica]|uniref:Uncharacterized protein n=1 Tax=Burkholderia aenigmatica TaxID=2015348 RepID=A0A228J4H3_9BURK|nr:hypothetical protein CFB84_00430 [Burkholderia aenigmatica]
MYRECCGETEDGNGRGAGGKVDASGALQAAPVVPGGMGAARQARHPADGMHDAICAAHAGFT